VAEWAEQYHRRWDERMDRLEDTLRELQQGDLQEKESRNKAPSNNEPRNKEQSNDAGRQHHDDGQATN
jgi:hypothetical protein